MAVYNNPYFPQQYQTPQTPVYQPQTPVYQPQAPAYQPPSIDWAAVAKACETLAGAAANLPATEYATKADLEKLKREILEGVKANAKPNA